jgi:hypothetical protein
MIHRWSVLCGRSIIDSNTNQISLFDVVEKVEAGVEVESLEKLKNEGKGILVIPINFELVSYISNIDPDKDSAIEMKLTLVDPKGTQLQESLPKFDMPEKIKNMRVRMGVQGMTVNESGVYLFKVWLKENKDKKFVNVAEIPVEVDLTIKEKK